jgi:hypothetical protein
MPTPVQFYLVIVAATILTNVVTFTISVLWPGATAARLASAASAAKVAMERIVQEAQEVLVPVAGVPPTAGRGGLRASTHEVRVVGLHGEPFIASGARNLPLGSGAVASRATPPVDRFDTSATHFPRTRS